MAVTKITADFIDTDAVETAQIKNVNVTTAKIADNAVTLAKLASGTDGEIITFDTSGDPTYLAVGTVQTTDTATNFYNGEFLQTGGAGAEPAWKVPILSKYYQSENTTITADTTHSFTHSLSAVPKLVFVVLECTTTDSGYSVGDQIDLSSDVGLNSSSTGASVYSTSTTVKVCVGSSIIVINPSGFNTLTLTLTSWKIVVKAFA
jgi:hypothetical protein